MQLNLMNRHKSMLAVGQEIFAGRPMVLVCLFGMIAFVILAIFAPLLTPQNPYDLMSLSILDGRLPPMSELSDGSLSLLGTDDQGRDLYSAIVYGLRVSIGVAVLSTMIALTFGLFLGLSAAMFGGWVEVFVMRAVDIKLSFPTIIIALLILVILGRGVDKVIFALAITQWAIYARVSRAAALSEMSKEYIEAAKTAGASKFFIMFRHLLPNSLSAIAVITTMQVAGAIGTEATLSFLGVGVPITEPSLGLLIANGYEYLLSGEYWISVYPGVALLMLVMSFNVVGDHMREYFNPRLRKN